MASTRISAVLRYLLTGVLLAALSWFAIRNADTVGQGFSSVRSASPGWVLMCVAAAIASLIAMAEVMYALVRAGGVSVTRRQASALTFASNSWSTTLPGGPALSTVFQFQVQRSWGASVVAISWFVLLSGAISTMWLVILGLAAVFFLGASFSLGSLAGVAAAMALLAAAVHWVATHPAVLDSWVSRVLPLLNRALRRPLDSGIAAAQEHIHQLDSVRLGPGAFVWVSAQSLLNRLFDLLTLWAAVAAVTGSASVTNLAGITIAYATAKIIGSTGVTPGGIGPVEAALAATLTAAGIPAAQALAAALVYRMISFIFITAVGWIVYAADYRHSRFSLTRLKSGASTTNAQELS